MERGSRPSVDCGSGPRPEQFWIADYFKDDRAAAFRCAETIAEVLILAMKANGYTTFAPPERPHEVEHVEFQLGCRVIVMWIPDWATNEHAGEWACRADTLASGKLIKVDPERNLSLSFATCPVHVGVVEPCAECLAKIAAGL